MLMDAGGLTTVTNQGKDLKIGIAEWQVVSGPARLVTLGLGSCVGVAIFSVKLRLGGMVHVMLPESTQFTNPGNPGKYADTGVPLVLKEMAKRGAEPRDLRAKIAGGAQMFSFSASTEGVLNIGRRNVEACKRVLAGSGIPLISEDVGGNFGRTMILDVQTGKVFVRAVGRELREI